MAVGMSILNVFRRVWWPHQAMLGRSVDVRGYHDTEYRQTTEHLPGLAIYRFDAPLLFANARTFRDQVRRLAAMEPGPVWIIVAAEPITDIDTTAADMLDDLDDDLVTSRNRLVFAELKDGVQGKVESGGHRHTQQRPFYPTIRTAVDAYADELDVAWVPDPPVPPRLSLSGWSTGRRRPGRRGGPRPSAAPAGSRDVRGRGNQEVAEHVPAARDGSTMLSSVGSPSRSTSTGSPTSHLALVVETGNRSSRTGPATNRHWPTPRICRIWSATCR